MSHETLKNIWRDHAAGRLTDAPAQAAAEAAMVTEFVGKAMTPPRRQSRPWAS
jgi:hypothetical protein